LSREPSQEKPPPLGYVPKVERRKTRVLGFPKRQKRKSWLCTLSERHGSINEHGTAQGRNRMHGCALSSIPCPLRHATSSSCAAERASVIPSCIICRRTRIDLRGCLWVTWLTRSRKTKGNIACHESDWQQNTCMQSFRKTRALWLKLNCLKSNSQGCSRSPAGQNV
jgi:hypothetical protein